MLAKHGAAERRVVRNARLHGVGLLRADDSIRRLFLQIKVADLHGAAKADDTGALLLGALIDHDSMGQDVLDLCDAAIQLGLLIFRFIIFTVLGKVAEGAGFLDLLRDFLLARGFQIIELFLELLQTFSGQLKFFCHSMFLPKSGKARSFVVIIEDCRRTCQGFPCVRAAMAACSCASSLFSSALE